MLIDLDIRSPTAFFVNGLVTIFARGCFLIFHGLIAGACFGQSPQNSSQTQIISYLEARIHRQPENASTWRMLGEAYRRQGRFLDAEEALHKAIALDDHCAAAHCNLAQLYAHTKRSQLAADHFARVAQLAPQSEYAEIAQRNLPHLPPPKSRVALAGYEIKTFDGSEILEKNIRPLPLDPDAPEVLSPLSLRLESGALYNTNVTLSPTSREFAVDQANSFQGFFNPDAQWRVFESGPWSGGAALVGYFNLNEADFRGLDLQSYQPAAFLERATPHRFGVLVGKTRYSFTLDEFQGATFALRHGLDVSLVNLWEGGDTTIVYWASDYTNFADDGAAPAQTSRDGWTNSLGVIHNFLLERRFLHALGIGSDAQIADVVGADFAYRGASLFLQTDLTLLEDLWLRLEGGWGYRDYHRSTLTPSRNENIWRSSARLRRILNDFWSLALVFSYDRFESKNALFQAERIIGGLVTVFEY